MPPDKTTYDKPIKTVDVGPYKVTIVILRRVPKQGSVDSALTHERVTEVYQIITGAGTFESGGTLANGQPVTSPRRLPARAPEALSRAGRAAGWRRATWW